MVPAGVDGLAAPHRVAAGDDVSGDENNSAQDDHEQKGADSAGRGRAKRGSISPQVQCDNEDTTRRPPRLVSVCGTSYAGRSWRARHQTTRRATQRYLVDADLFLSADKRLNRVLTAVSNQAPFDVAEPRPVKPASARSRVRHRDDLTKSDPR
jgi:hypothetical protein